MLKPIRKSEFAESKADDQVLLYSAETEAIHCLNPTAYLIWTLCDGEHTIEDLVANLRASFAIPDGIDLRADVQRTLDTFVRKGLLQ